MAKGPPSARPPLTGNPHLSKDLRTIGIVTIVLAILLVVVSIAL